MKILITCGPSYEPIDGARRMANMSTGKIGVTLANHFAEAGHEVIYLKGEGATYAGSVIAGRTIVFSTNDDLVEKLASISRSELVDVVLHPAALCDYRVEGVRNDSGDQLISQKFATRSGRLHVALAPATKVLPRLRGTFHKAAIVGWKYELAGTRAEAFDKAWHQIRDGGTDACVLNGAAYGDGFAICRRDGSVGTCTDSAELCQKLKLFLSARLSEILAAAHALQYSL